MNSTQLQYLITLNRTRSINAAAKALFVSPSGLCTAVHKLEQELGLQLIQTSRKGVEFTAAGNDLVELSEQYLTAVEKLSLENAAQLNGTLRIPFVSDFVDSFFADFIPWFSMEHPNIEFEAIERRVPEIAKMLQAGDVNVAIVLNASYFTKRKIDYASSFTPLVKARGYIKVAPYHQLAKKTSVSINEIVDYPIILPIDQRESAHNTIFDGLFELYSIKPMAVSFERNRKVLDNKILHLGQIGISFFSEYKKPEDSLSHILVPIREDIGLVCGYSIRKGSELSPLELEFTKALDRYFSG